MSVRVVIWDVIEVHNAKCYFNILFFYPLCAVINKDLLPITVILFTCSSEPLSLLLHLIHDRKLKDFYRQHSQQGFELGDYIKFFDIRPNKFLFNY